MSSGGDGAKTWVGKANGHLKVAHPPKVDVTTARSPPPGSAGAAVVRTRLSRKQESPHNCEGFSKLPNGTCSGRILSGFVIDLDKARKRLRPETLEVPTIVKRLAQAEEWQRQLDAGEVKHRAEISQRHGVSRARVTQIMHLLRLHPIVLDYLRSLGPETPERMITERKLRQLIGIPNHAQVANARFLLVGFQEFIIESERDAARAKTIDVMSHR